MIIEFNGHTLFHFIGKWTQTDLTRTRFALSDFRATNSFATMHFILIVYRTKWSQIWKQDAWNIKN